MKRIIINIKTCADCPHVDHSGQLIPGGGIDICGNRDTSMVRDPSYKKDKYHWKHRVLKIGKKGELIIPDWCPLSP